MAVKPEDLTYTAVCIWEAFLDQPPSWFPKLREDIGTSELRDRAISLAGPCHEAWAYAHAVLEFDDSFDWEWVPAWIEACVDDQCQAIYNSVSVAAKKAMKEYAHV